MKKFIKGIFLLFVVSGYVFAWNITGKIANWDYKDGGDFTIIAATDPFNPGGSMVSSTTIYCWTNSVSGTYTLTGILDGTYFIYGLLDLSGDGVPQDNEPSGSYQVFGSTMGDEPVDVSGADKGGIDFVCRSKKGPYILKGLVRDDSGKLLPGATVYYNRWATEHNSNGDTTPTYSTSVVVGSLNSYGNPYYIPDWNWEIILDTTSSDCIGYNGEYQEIVVEAPGYSPAQWWLWFSTDTESALFFETILSTGEGGSGGNITGTISYSGTQTGDLYIMVGHGEPEMWKDAPSLIELSPTNLGTVASSQSYNTGLLPAATDYTVVAWVDSDPDSVGEFDSSTEAGGSSSPVTVIDGSTTTVDLTLQDPGTPSPPPSGEFSLKINSVSPSKISPDNDGVDDFFTLDFDILAGTSSAESASVRIVADTNGNGKADAFDWSKIVWDDSGGPAIDENSNGIYDEGIDTSISYEELNAYQSEYDWEYWDWIDSSLMTADFNGTGRYGTSRSLYLSISDPWLGRIPSSGTCKIFLDVNYDNWSNTSSTSAQTSIEVEVSGMYGKILDDTGNPIPRARIEANSPEGNGVTTYSNDSGTYKLNGLIPGKKYYINVRKKGYTQKNEEIVAPASYNEYFSKDFVLDKGILVTGTVTLPEPFFPYEDTWGNYISEFWGWVNAWSVDSPDGGWVNFRISSGSKTGNWQMQLSPGTYEFSAGGPDYISSSTKTVLSEGTTSYSLNLSLQKSTKITGYVILQDTQPYSRWVNINARPLSNNGSWGWGWGEVPPEKSSGTFIIEGLIPNTDYELRFYAEQYAEYVSTINSQNGIEGLKIQMEKGVAITGNINIYWNQASINFYTSNEQTELWLNLDAHSNKLNQGSWAGVNVTVPATPSTTTVKFELYGLVSGEEYFINIWGIQEQFEYKPIKVSAPQTNLSIDIFPFNGEIKGKVTGVSDYSNVYIRAQRLWDWNANEFVVQPDTSGIYSIKGLGTGEYIVMANEYIPTYDAQDNTTYYMAIGSKGSFMQRVSVSNNAVTNLDIILQTAGSIKGAIEVVSDNYTLDDIINSSATMKAVPLKLFHMMGPEEAVKKAVFGKLVKVSSTVARFELKGLSEDSYVLCPPVYFDTSNDTSTLTGRMSMVKDLAVETKIVPISQGLSVDVGTMTLRDGYKVKAVIKRPQANVENFFWVRIQPEGRWDPVSQGREVAFTDWNGNRDKFEEAVEFASVLPGKYNMIVETWDQSYKTETVPFEIIESTVTKTIDLGIIFLKKGANIKGKIVDAETGQPVYKVKVRCEAVPWKEGTWRETANWDDEWAPSDIKISSQTGVFKLMNLPEGTYRVWVEDTREQAAVKYVTFVKNGIEVPDTAGDVDIGTIRLEKGKEISGLVRLKSDKSPLPNITVVAMPTGAQGGFDWIMTQTDIDGKFTLKGLKPNTSFWTIIASPYREPGDIEGKPSIFPEERKRNVVIGSTDTVIELSYPDATLSGKIYSPVGQENELFSPWEEGGMRTPGALLLVQREGEVYSDPMGGYKIMSSPPKFNEATQRWEADYYFSSLISGTYILKAYSKGFTSVAKKITISTGTNTVDIVFSTGAVLTGTIIKDNGEKLTTSEVEEVVAATQDLSQLIFGELESNSSTLEIESYRIEGLEIGKTYFIAFPTESRVFIAPDPQYIGSSTQTYNIVFKDNPPVFVTRTRKVDNILYINVMSMEPLRESDADEILTLDKVISGTTTYTNRSFSENVLSSDKTEISAKYVFQGDEDYIVFSVQGTDLKGNEMSKDTYQNTYPDATEYPFTYTYYRKWDIMKQASLSPMTGGTVELGEGDDSNLYFPPGSISGKDECKVEIIKTATETLPSPSLKSSVKAAKVSALRKVYGYAVGSLGAWPENAKGVVSDLYTITPRLISGPLASIASGQSVQLTLSYDPAQVSVSTMLYVASSVDTDDDGVADSDWAIVDTTPQIDTENHTITVEVTHFSQYAVWELSAVPSGTQSSPVISSISPSSGKQGETVPLITITGSDFASGASVSFSNIGITVTSSTVSGGNIYVYNVKISSTAPTGSCNVTVTNPDGGSYTLADGFIVNSKDIVITGITLSDSTPQQYQIIQATVSGTGFSSGLDSARFEKSGYNFSVSTVTYVSTDTLRLDFQIPANASTGTYRLLVWNSSTNESTSLEDALTVEFAISITTATPVYFRQGDSGNLTITGSGFGASGSISISGTGIILGTPSSWSDTQIIVPVTVVSTATTGYRDITIINNNGSQRTIYNALEVKILVYSGVFKVYPYPNPSNGSVNIKFAIPGDDSTAGDTIKAKVTIYTITGEEVVSLEKDLEVGIGPGDDNPNYDGQNIITWDGKNEASQDVATGVYFYIAEVAGRGTRKGKIAIIR